MKNNDNDTWKEYINNASLTESFNNGMIALNMENVLEESQSRFNALLLYVNNELIKPYKPSFQEYKHGVYNMNCIKMICEWYIMICLSCDKECSINGFSFLTGINAWNIKEWGNLERLLLTSNDRESSLLKNEIYKNISTINKETLENRLFSSKSNNIGVLAILNNRYNYNNPGIVLTQNDNAISCADLPEIPTLSE